MRMIYTFPMCRFPICKYDWANILIQYIFYMIVLNNFYWYLLIDGILETLVVMKQSGSCTNVEMLDHFSSEKVVPNQDSTFYQSGIYSMWKLLCSYQKKSKIIIKKNSNDIISTNILIHFLEVYHQSIIWPLYWLS